MGGIMGQVQGVPHDPTFPLYREVLPLVDQVGGEVGLVAHERRERAAGRRVQGLYL